jgi:hypothetical protein
LDAPFIHAFLAGSSYWARNVPITVVLRSIEHSLCFRVYDGARQNGDHPA